MIAVDTSVLIDYFQGKNNRLTDIVDTILSYHSLTIPPVVLVETLSDPFLPKLFVDKILELPVLMPKENFWQRAGITRSKILSKKLKAALADTLIAQSCIDYEVSLITGDHDFKHFSQYCGLMLFPNN